MSISMRALCGRLAILAACVLFVMPITAQAQNPIITVPQDSYFETLRSSQQVNATGRLVGVMGNAGAFDVERPVVTVSGLDAADKTICIDISHVSGVYLGRARIENPGLAGTVSFRLPARLLSRASETDREYAILARASSLNVCHQRNNILLASWGTREPAGEIVLAVSTAQTSSLGVNMEGLGSRASCSAASSYVGSSDLTFQRFTRVCRAELPSTCRERSRFELIIEESGARVPTRRRLLRRSCP